MKRCAARDCRRRYPLIFLVASAVVDEPGRAPGRVDNVGLYICPVHAKLHVNGFHVPLRTQRENVRGDVALIGERAVRIGILDAAGYELTE